MKGIILAGGAGSRLWPISSVLPKPLLPVFDKPMIYYPISTMIEIGVTEILIITSPQADGLFQQQLGDGSQRGCSFSYEIQHEARGTADAFLIGERFIGDDTVALLYGDNLFFDHGLGQYSETLLDPTFTGAMIAAYRVSNPSRFGVVEFDKHGKVLSVEEKPSMPKSSYAIAGIYFFDNSIVEKAKRCVPSGRGELEITDAVGMYLEEGALQAGILPDNAIRFDTGTFGSLHKASVHLDDVLLHQNKRLGCPEVAAWERGLLSDEQLKELAQPLVKSGYGQYLLDILEQ